MSDDNLQLLTIALQLIDTVSRQENAEIGLYDDINGFEFYNRETLDRIVRVERVRVND